MRNMLRPFQLLRCLRGVQLPCGCQVGVYEAFGGENVCLVDERGADCPLSEHQIDAAIDVAGDPARGFVLDRGSS